jgi:sigma-54 specific flagellar transcriptional regulator A
MPNRHDGRSVVAAVPKVSEIEATPLIGRSEPMRTLRQLIEKIALSRATVLITGESGTGKELVAQALHAHGPRGTGPFVPINCGAIPRELLESELFGHRKGAFTGALAHRIGRFEMAHGGTLFLDEVGDLPLDMQVKLLRVLQSRRVEPLGAAESIPIDVRVVAATHRQLDQDVAEGRFREDLYYRLNVIPMRTAALRERPEDIGELLEFYARRHAAEGSGPVVLDDDLTEALHRYEWPGNVRELSNLVDRFSALFPGQRLTLAAIPDWVLPHGLARIRASQWPALAVRGVCQPADTRHETPGLHASVGMSREPACAEPDDGRRDRMEDSADMSGANPAEVAIRLAIGLEPLGDQGLSLRDRMQQIERGYIEQALERTNWNVSQTARLLSLQRTTLIEKINKYGMRKL